MVETLALSPDGKRVVVENQEHLVLIDPHTGGIAKDLGEGLMPQWSPQGNHVAFYSNRSGSLQMWAWDLPTDQFKQLTNLSNGVDPDPTTRIMGLTADSLRLAWSPDGTAIAFASRVARAGADDAGPLILDNSTPTKLTLAGVFANPGHNAGVTELRKGREWAFRQSHPGESLASQIFVAYVNTGQVVQLTRDVQTVFHPTWFPDGKTLVAARVNSVTAIENLEDAVTQSRNTWTSEIVTVDVRTSSIASVLRDQDLKYQPKWSPDGRRLAFLSSSGIYDVPRLRVLEGNDPTREVPGLALRSDDFSWTSSDSLLVYYTTPPSERRFAHVRIEPLTLSKNDIALKLPRDILKMPDRWSLASTGSLAWVNGAQLWYLAATDRKPRLVRDFDTHEDNIEWGGTEAIAWRNSNHELHEGRVLFPPGYQKSRRYPMIVDVYPNGGGGDSPNSTGWLLPWEGNQAWAAQGYVIFVPRPRSPFYLNYWCGNTPECEKLKGPRGWDRGVDDVLSGVDELVRRGIADSNRVCVYGHSNGGGFASYLITKTHIFKCAVILAPALADLVRNVVLNTDGGSIPAYTDGLTLDKDLDEYVAMSPVFHLQHVDTPLLIAVGDQDGEFLLNAIELYNGVRRAQSNVTLLRYPGQGHLISGTALEDLWKRELDFFARYLRTSN